MQESIRYHRYLTAHYRFIVPIKGAAPPAINKTLERVALKQASRNPPLEATFKRAALNTQLSKPPPNTQNKHPCNAQVLMIFIAPPGNIVW